jgi:hypothetical protein
MTTNWVLISNVLILRKGGWFFNHEIYWILIVNINAVSCSEVLVNEQRLRDSYLAALYNATSTQIRSLLDPRSNWCCTIANRNPYFLGLLQWISSLPTRLIPCMGKYPTCSNSQVHSFRLATCWSCCELTSTPLYRPEAAHLGDLMGLWVLPGVRINAFLHISRGSNGQ